MDVMKYGEQLGTFKMIVKEKHSKPWTYAGSFVGTIFAIYIAALTNFGSDWTASDWKKKLFSACASALLCFFGSLFLLNDKVRKEIDCSRTDLAKISFGEYKITKVAVVSPGNSELDVTVGRHIYSMRIENGTVVAPSGQYFEDGAKACAYTEERQ